MAIQIIDRILVNGSSSLYGGWIYNLRYNIAYGDSQSVVKISVISESGEYSISPNTLKNTYCNLYTIKIGNQITFTGFLESYNKTISPAGKTLELEFVDSSRVLDIIYIGLFKRHGIKSTSKMIIVGKEIDACNPDGYKNPVKTFFDPCNPCITDAGVSANVNYINCVDKSKYEIHDVKYNFTELLSKLPIKIRGARDINPKYLASYTGTIRDVLSSWAKDFGFFFYWENGTVVFKDLRNTIQVGAAIDDFCPNLTEYNESFSMKNSVKTATITNFTRPGDPDNTYECRKAKYIECESLKQNVTYSMPLTISPKIDSIAAGLANYDDGLRTLYYFYVKYQMYNSSNFTPGKLLEKLGMKILSPQITFDGSLKATGKNISIEATPAEFLSLETKEKIISLDPFTVHPDNLSGEQKENIATIKTNNQFYQCVSTLDPVNKWKIINNPRGYFFFLASKDNQIEQKYLDEEKRFANFLHKYAVYVPDPNDDFFQDYDFTLDNLCGYRYFVDTGNITYRAIGDTTGNFTFYNTSSQGSGAGFDHIMGDLPFAEFLSIIRDRNSSTSSSNTSMAFKLIVVERGRNSFVPSPVTHTESDREIITNYITLSKAKWYLPYEAAHKNSLSGALIASITDSDLNQSTPSNTYLYLAHNVSEQDFKLTEISAFNDFASFGTLFDGTPINKQENPETQREEIIYRYPELKCKILGNHSYGGRTSLHAQKIVFKTPVGSFKYTEPTDALFGIVVEKVHRKKRAIKKVESFNSTNLNNTDTCDYAKLNVNYENISDDRLKILTKNNSVCKYNTQTIQSIHNEFSKNLSLNFKEPTISKSFRIAGIELSGYTPSIENGLISIDIAINDNGLYSTYEFGTRLMKLPKIDTRIFGKNDRPGSYTNTVNRYPLVGETQT